MLNTTLNFKRGKVNTKFDLVHNLDEFGLSIDVVLINWGARTDTFTEENFIEYVKSKDPVNLICVPKNRYGESNSN